jgi:uncharacterized membrane protein YgaE (UPF0421/DUF939 family)
MIKNFWVMLDKFLRALFIDNPIKTSLGAVTGVAFKYILDFFLELSQIATRLHILGAMCSFIFVFHIIPLKPSADPEAQKIVATVQEVLKESNLSSEDQKRVWNQVVESYLKSYVELSAQRANNTSDKDVAV